MITLTTAQIDAWIVAFAYPLARILAFIGMSPVWGTSGIPRRMRLVLGITLSITITPIIPPLPAIAPASWTGLAILGQEILLGLAMGFAMRVVFAATDLAGEFIGMQMGLGFATFYDPLNSAQTPVVAEFLGLLALLLFLALDGHLLYVSTLAQSFSVLPIGGSFPGAGSWLNIVELGGKLFALGLLLSLPVVVALIITNIALAVLTRAAPQLNIFALGFPLTLIGGFVALALSTRYLAVPLQQIYEVALSAILGFAVK